jgi:hypothetical protein
MDAGTSASVDWSVCETPQIVNTVVTAWSVLLQLCWKKTCVDMRDIQGLCTTERYERPNALLETYMHDKRCSVIIHDFLQMGDSVRYPWTSFLFVHCRV